MNETICFVAGKSGGHLLPCIALAKKIYTSNQHTNILFFTTQSKLDNDIVASQDCITQHYTLPLSSLTGSIFSYIRFCITMIWSFCLSFFYLLRLRPKKIVSTGGAVSLPVCFAGWLLRIPIELLELNVIPGKALSTLAPLAKTISLCFNETQKYFNHKCYTTQYPLRFNAQARRAKNEARNYLGLDPVKKTIFIIGGSQGSLFINNLIKSWIETSLQEKKDLQFIHQIGSQDSVMWQEFYKKSGLPVFIFSFYNQIEYCYSAADLVICRSGAGTLFEIQFFNKPCITIPLETKSTNHQVDNAYAFKKMHKNFCEVILQKESQQGALNTINKALDYI